MNELKNIRLKRGLTQRQLSQKSGITEAIISKYENGRKGISVPNLIRLSDALKIPVCEILGMPHGSRPHRAKK